MSNNLQISYSSSGTFDSCNRKFEFRKIYPRSKPRTSGFAAEVGKCLHEGFKNFLIHQSEEQAIWALLESFPYELEYYETTDDGSLEACVSVPEISEERCVGNECVGTCSFRGWRSL